MLDDQHEHVYITISPQYREGISTNQQIVTNMSAELEPVITSTSLPTSSLTSSLSVPARGTCVWNNFISHPDTSTDALTAGVACIPPGGGLARHFHGQAEIYHVTAAEGTMTLGEKEFTVKPGDVIYTPANMMHGVRNAEGAVGDLRFLYVFPCNGFADVAYHWEQDVAAVSQ